MNLAVVQTRAAEGVDAPEVAVEVHALGRVTQYQYDYSRDRREFTAIEITPAPVSRTLERVYDLEGRLIENLTGTRREYERRADGPLVDYIKDERGLVTRTERDSYRNVIEEQHPDGTTESWKYLPALSYVSEYTDELGVRSTYAYDTNGRITEAVQAAGTSVERRIVYTYTQFGQVETRTVNGETPADDATAAYVYDNYGNRTQTTDAEEQVISETYDVMGNVLTRTDARGKTTEMTYSAAGWPETSRTPLQFLTQMEYDQTGKRIKNIGPIDGTRTSETIFRYDELDRLVETEDPLGGASKQRYDEEGRLYESEDARGVIIRLGFDASSRMNAMTDGNGNVTETVYGDTSGALEGLVARKIYPTFEERYKYDQLDRQVEVTQVLSPTLSYTTTSAFDAVGNVISTTDAKGRTNQRFYDERRRMTKEIDPLLGETHYTYDSRDNLLSVTDANGNTHRFTYDKVNRKKTEARPMGQTITYHYDASGNLIERISPSGAKRLFVYDDDNRLEREEHYLPGESDPDKTITYGYDQRGLLIAYDDSLTSGAYIYDDKGQKISETVTFGTGPTAFSKTLIRTYEPNGLPGSLTYPGSAGTVTYSYHSNNQLQTYRVPGLTAGNDTLSYSYRWNAIESVNMLGNLSRTVTLDPLQRPTRILVQGTGNNGEPVMDHRYEYDQTSNITRKTTLDGPYSYRYDGLDRLTGATPAPALLRTPADPNGLPDEAYTYDNVHNRLTSAHQPGPWIYNANNELKQWGTGGALKVIDYDDNGLTISEQTGNPVTTTRTYVYDAQDRMVEVKGDGTLLASYAYSPFGQNVWREISMVGAEPVGVTWFFNSDEGLIGEYQENGEVVREYGWKPQRPWGTDPTWLRDGGELHFAHNDHLFTTELLTRPNGSEVSWAANREAFGSVTVREGATTTYLLRFPGQWEDRAGGFDSNWWREYGAASGRYKSVDPIGFLGGVSLFNYAEANPLRWIDNNGLKAWFCARPMNGTREVRPMVVINHFVLCVTTKDGTIVCGGFGPDPETHGVPFANPIFGTPGRFFYERFTDLSCNLLKPTDCPRCLEDCILRKFKEEASSPGRRYSITPMGTDCQEWAHDTWVDCGLECKEAAQESSNQCGAN